VNALHREALHASLRDHGHAEVVVGGRSMHPFIRDGDAVVIDASVRTPRVGDVVALFNDGQLIVHRVVRRRNQGGMWLLRIRGDTSPGPGVDVAADAVLGVVTAVKRAGHMHRLWVASPIRWLAVPLGAAVRCVVRLRGRASVFLG